MINELAKLFEATKNELPATELAYFAGLDQQAKIDAENLSASLTALVNLIGGDAPPTSNQLISVLCGLAKQADLVAAQIAIATEARETGGAS